MEYTIKKEKRNTHNGKDVYFYGIKCRLNSNKIREIGCFYTEGGHRSIEDTITEATKDIEFSIKNNIIKEIL